MERDIKEGTQKTPTQKLDAVGEQLISNMPEPQPNVVDHGEAVTQEGGPTLKDTMGRAFNSALHKIGVDGKPVLTPKGFLKTLAGKGRRSNIGGLSNPTAPGTPTAPEPNYEACGLTAAHSIFFFAQGIGGQEWEPDQKEAVYMSSAWTEYFRAKGIQDIPPGVMLLTALISYAAPRFGKPVTKSRCKKAYSWLISKFSRKENYYGSHVDSRNDRERKDDFGNTTGQGIPTAGN
jgi:hypothetical protein